MRIALRLKTNAMRDDGFTVKGGLSKTARGYNKDPCDQIPSSLTIKKNVVGINYSFLNAYIMLDVNMVTR